MIPRTVRLALVLPLDWSSSPSLCAVSYKWIKGDLIGRGTFGHVYIGFSVNTGETIAVKQVELPKSQHDKDDARTKGMVQSLKAEIELLKDLDHPNIVLYLGES